MLSSPSSTGSVHPAAVSSPLLRPDRLPQEIVLAETAADDASDEYDVEEDEDDEAQHAFVLVDDFDRHKGQGHLEIHFSLLGLHASLGQRCGDESVKILALLNSRGSPQKHAVIAPTTQVHFLYQRYNVVLALDMTPSMASVAPHRGYVLLEQLLDCVERCIRLILRPIRFSDSENPGVLPDILLSVIGHGVSRHPFRALLLLWPLRVDNVAQTLELVRRRAAVFESELANSRARFEVTPNNSSSGLPPAVDLSVMLASTLFCLDRMPPDRSPLAFFLTDGVVATPESGTFENVFSSIGRKDVVIHTVLITCSQFHSELPLGYCPETDSLALLSQHSGGVSLTLSDFEDKRWSHPL